MKFQAIKTLVGIVAGRNAIYLHNIEHRYEDQTIVFEGIFESQLCSDYAGNKEELKYKITFNRVLYFRMVELDHYPLNILNETVSSIDENIDSQLIQELKAKDSAFKVRPEHRHFIIATYDDIFDVVAFDVKIEVEND